MDASSNQLTIMNTTGIVKVVDQENNEVAGVVGTGYKVVIEGGEI